MRTKKLNLKFIFQYDIVLNATSETTGDGRSSQTTSNGLKAPSTPYFPTMNRLKVNWTLLKR